MQQINKASKFFYFGCFLLILLHLGRYISKLQTQYYLQSSWEFLATLPTPWDNQQSNLSSTIDTVPSLERTQPLVMEGGDPYIRALMRTITASEANVKRPYNVIYGGEYIEDLSQHPQVCVPIATGPNVGQCSTAAGRY
ncbi:MAG: glycoside hydrolase, partial [Waterburya sp.]